MKGLIFKHPARKQRYKFLMAERIRKHPCLYCPKKLLYLLRGTCEYVPVGGFSCKHENKTGLLVGIIQSCVYKYAPLGEHPNHEYSYVV